MYNITLKGVHETTVAMEGNKYYICGRTIKFAKSPPCACRGSTGQKP